jgi:hypothetical protein
MKNKSYPFNSIQEYDGKKGKIMRKKCHQCGEQSVIRYRDTSLSLNDWSESCLNGCGPELLYNLLNSAFGVKRGR